MRHSNGYGTVIKLSGKRRKPYAVRVWVKDGKGGRKRQYVGYASTKKEAIEILAEYNKKPWNVGEDNKTFSEVYQLWRETTNLADNTVRGYESKYRCYCQELYDIPYNQLRARHFRSVIDGCGKSNSTKNQIRKFFRQLDKVALEYEIIDKGYSGSVESLEEEESKRKIFTEEEIEKLWEKKETPHAKLVLIYLYTGFRREELAQLKLKDIDLDNWVMTGGLKTKAGKNRKVPIHKRIRPIVKEYVEKAEAAGYDTLFGVTGKTLAQRFGNTMKKFGMNHVIHECRHTFRTRLDDAEANKRCIDLMMGHASQDVGERIYTHKTMKQLHEAINLIK